MDLPFLFNKLRKIHGPYSGTDNRQYKTETLDSSKIHGAMPTLTLTSLFRTLSRLWHPSRAEWSHWAEEQRYVFRAAVAAGIYRPENQRKQGSRSPYGVSLLVLGLRLEYTDRHGREQPLQSCDIIREITLVGVIGASGQPARRKLDNHTGHSSDTPELPPWE